MRQYVTTALFTISVITLSACQTAPTPGDEMRAQGAEYTTMAKNWDKGNSQINKGERLIKQGQKEIRSGENKIKKGRKMVSSGQNLVKQSESKFGTK